MKCERFIFRGNLSILLIKVKITASATVFCSGYDKLKIFLVLRNLVLRSLLLLVASRDPWPTMLTGRGLE